MNILSVSNDIFLKPYQTDNVKNKNNTAVTPYFGLKLSQPLQKDTVSFKSALFVDTMTVKQSKRYGRIATIFQDILESIAMKYKDKGVSFCRDYCELNAVKSAASTAKKIARTSSVDIRDQVRSTLFIKDLTDMKLLDDILKDLEERGLVLDTIDMSIEDLIARGYVPKKNDKDFVRIPDLDIRLAEGREGIINLEPRLQYSFSNPQKSGYEDVQMRLIRSYDSNKNPVRHELLILTGENYAIAKHIESKYIYSVIRDLGSLEIVKKQNENNEQIKLIKRYIDLIKQLCSTEISQKLFENAKNKDVYGIENILPIKVSDKDIKTLNNYFDEIRKNAEIYYTNAKKNAIGNRRAQNHLQKEKNCLIESITMIEQRLSQSIKQVNKGNFPKTMEELICEVKKEKTLAATK